MNTQLSPKINKTLPKKVNHHKKSPAIKMIKKEDGI